MFLEGKTTVTTVGSLVCSSITCAYTARVSPTAVSAVNVTTVGSRRIGAAHPLTATSTTCVTSRWSSISSLCSQSQVLSLYPLSYTLQCHDTEHSIPYGNKLILMAKLINIISTGT